MKNCKHAMPIQFVETMKTCRLLDNISVFPEECEKCDGEGNWGKPTRLDKIIYFFMRLFK